MLEYCFTSPLFDERVPWHPGASSYENTAALTRAFQSSRCRTGRPEWVRTHRKRGLIASGIFHLVNASGNDDPVAAAWLPLYRLQRRRDGRIEARCCAITYSAQNELFRRMQAAVRGYEREDAPPELDLADLPGVWCRVSHAAYMNWLFRDMHPWLQPAVDGRRCGWRVRTSEDDPVFQLPRP